MGLGDIIDTANSALHGGDPAAAQPDANAEFLPGGDPLDDLHSEVAAAPFSVGSDGDGLNTLDHEPVEYIHYGRVWQAAPANFAHPADKPGRAQLVRDALEREAVTLFQQAYGHAFALTELQKSRGALGAVGAIAGKLMGSGDSEPSTDELTKIVDKVCEAAGKINVDKIKYKDLHQCGNDLHQARANLNAFAGRTRGYYVDKLKSGSGGMLSKLPLAGVGADALDLVTKFTFKPLDVSLALYLDICAEYGDAVDGACRDFGIWAIKYYKPDKPTPTFPVWFTPPKAPDAPAAPGDSGDDPIAKVNKAIQDAKGKVDEVYNAWKDFWGESPPDAPGKDGLDKLFAAFNGTGDKRLGPGKTRPYKKLGDVVVDSLSATITNPPGFISDAMKKTCDVAVEFLQEVMTKVMNNSANFALTDESLMGVAREQLFGKIMDLIVGFIPGGSNVANDNKLVNFMGFGLTGNQIKNKVADFGNDKVGQYAEIVLQVAVKHLAGHLESARTIAAGSKATTMEWFLGELPLLAMLMVRNIFFPVWDIIIDKVFGIADKLASLGVSPIKGIVNDAGDVTAKIKDVSDRVTKVANLLSSGVSGIGGAMAIYNAVTGGPAGPSGGGGGGARFPGAARVEKGSAAAIDDAPPPVKLGKI